MRISAGPRLVSMPNTVSWNLASQGTNLNVDLPECEARAIALRWSHTVDDIGIQAGETIAKALGSLKIGPRSYPVLDLEAEEYLKAIQALRGRYTGLYDVGLPEDGVVRHDYMCFQAPKGCVFDLTSKPKLEAQLKKPSDTWGGSTGWAGSLSIQVLTADLGAYAPTASLYRAKKGTVNVNQLLPVGNSVLRSVYFETTTPSYFKRASMKLPSGKTVFDYDDMIGLNRQFCAFAEEDPAEANANKFLLPDLNVPAYEGRQLALEFTTADSVFALATNVTSRKV